MRRSFLCCAVALATALVAGQPAWAQLNSPARWDASAKSARVSSGSQGRMLWRFSSTTALSGGGFTGLPSSSVVRDHGYHRHHRGHRHDHEPGSLLLYSAPGYSLAWGNGLIGGFWPYGFSYPNVVQQGFSVWSPAAVQAPVVPAPARAIDPPANDPAPSDPAPPKVRKSNTERKARAGKFIGYGDTNFGKQNYLAAAQRYKTAARTAPDLAEPHFRQGFAYIAMGKYDAAVNAFRRGLGIRADWTGSPFRLDQIYGDGQIAKTAHLESLAKAVETNPLDAELLVALGMHVYFEGQPQRSQVFFERAAQLGGNEDHLLDSFLPRPGPAGAPKPAAGPKQDGKVVF